MLEAVQALASFLARDPLTLDQVVQELGTVVEDFGSNFVIAPYDPLFDEANIVRGIDLTTFKPSDSPAHVELTPVEPPAVEELAESFGTYTRVPAEDKGVPPQVIFYLDIPDRPCIIALIAEVKRGRAINITLRRDRRH